ncbi:DUF2752 domain-containing protein [bacterium]|nr:DUF2752 domain-containing protein [bacterium]
MIATLGVPCPGCGLTRSVTAIFHGDFLAAWQYNPFGYFFALGFALLAPVAVLPGRQITRLKEALRPQSYRIAVVLIAFTVGLMLHGITRAVLVGTHSTTYAWWWDGSQVPPAFQHLMEEE